MKDIIKTVTQIFAKGTNSAIFIALFSLILFFLFYLPVKTVPGNDFRFQLSILSKLDMFLLVALSFFSALVLTVQVSIFRNKFFGVDTAVVGGIGFISALISSLFGTASCSLCVGALFSFLGAGTVIALFDNRFYITLGSLALLFISLYLSSRQFNGACKECSLEK